MWHSDSIAWKILDNARGWASMASGTSGELQARDC